ncbi:MAG: hypothetical protein ABIT83_21525 [Massilia sp.]
MSSTHRLLPRALLLGVLLASCHESTADTLRLAGGLAHADSELVYTSGWRLSPRGEDDSRAPLVYYTAVTTSPAPVSGIDAEVSSNAAADAAACLIRWLQCSAFGAVETRVPAEQLVRTGLTPAPGAPVPRGNLVAGLMLGLRFDFPDTREAGHGPWFVQFKLARRTPGYRGSIPLPRHAFGALTVGTEF